MFHVDQEGYPGFLIHPLTLDEVDHHGSNMGLTRKPRKNAASNWTKTIFQPNFEVNDFVLCRDIWDNNRFLVNHWQSSILFSLLVW